MALTWQLSMDYAHYIAYSIENMDKHASWTWQMHAEELRKLQVYLQTRWDARGDGFTWAITFLTCAVVAFSGAVRIVGQKEPFRVKLPVTGILQFYTGAGLCWSLLYLVAVIENKIVSGRCAKSITSVSRDRQDGTKLECLAFMEYLSSEAQSFGVHICGVFIDRDLATSFILRLAIVAPTAYATLHRLLVKK